jgi:hypothetical protein
MFIQHKNFKTTKVQGAQRKKLCASAVKKKLNRKGAKHLVL